MPAPIAPFGYSPFINMLVVGRAGSGKTRLLDTLAELCATYGRVRRFTSIYHGRTRSETVEDLAPLVEDFEMPNRERTTYLVDDLVRSDDDIETMRSLLLHAPRMKAGIILTIMPGPDIVRRMEEAVLPRPYGRAEPDSDCAIVVMDPLGLLLFTGSWTAQWAKEFAELERMSAARDGRPVTSGPGWMLALRRDVHQYGYHPLGVNA